MAQERHVCIECNHCGIATEALQKSCTDTSCPKVTFISNVAEISEEDHRAYFGGKPLYSSQ